MANSIKLSINSNKSEYCYRLADQLNMSDEGLPVVEREKHPVAAVVIPIQPVSDSYRDLIYRSLYLKENQVVIHYPEGEPSYRQIANKQDLNRVKEAFLADNFDFLVWFDGSKHQLLIIYPLQVGTQRDPGVKFVNLEVNEPDKEWEIDLPIAGFRIKVRLSLLLLQ